MIRNKIKGLVYHVLCKQIVLNGCVNLNFIALLHGMSKRFENYMRRQIKQEKLIKERHNKGLKDFCRALKYA